MTVWVVLPVKPLSLGKSRLHAYLERDEVPVLNLELFQSTYARLKACSKIDRIMVVSKDEMILEKVQQWGGDALKENSPSSLNKALAQAFAAIKDIDEGPVLVIPADLPQMETEDLERLVNFAQTENFLVIIPDYNQTGTNALFMSRPGLIEPRFGRRSFQKHLKQALLKNVNLTVWLNKKMQSDLDTPQDLQNYTKINLYSKEIIN